MEKLSKKESQVQIQEGKHKKIFGLSKMQQTFIVNLFRIDVFWDLSIAHFLVIANSKSISLRVLSVETLCNCIFSAFDFLLLNKKSLKKIPSIFLIMKNGVAQIGKKFYYFHFLK